VLTGLPAVEKWSIVKTTLTLSGSSGKALFVYSSVPSGLPGTSWTARGVNNGVGAVESTSLTEVLTLQFGTDGALTGFGGCNNFSGQYASSAPPDLAISGIASTKKACAEDVMKLETAYLTALGNTATYKREGTTLNLRDASGATQANFELDTGG
jgi:heat shock protein HslJ